MTKIAPKSCTAFSAHTRIATGPLAEVARAAKALVDRDDQASILIFDDATSQTVEVDFRGTPEDVAGRLSARFNDPEAPGRAGRPKLGVVGREITLLPRHWDWLAQQPGGASVVIRRLIDAARKASGFKDLARQAQETTFRFMNTVAGNFPDYEEVTRALFADDRATFTRLTEQWPTDVRDHARWLMTGGGAATSAEIDR